FAFGAGVGWSRILGASDKDAFKVGRVYGLAAQGNQVLVAWGPPGVLRLATLTGTGTLVARADDPNFFGNLGSRTASAFAYDTGLLMFDGNPVRMTQLGFDLTRQVRGQNAELLAFYQTAPQVASIVLGEKLLAFWLTVFPVSDGSQASTTHQLYGCEL